MEVTPRLEALTFPAEGAQVATGDAKAPSVLEPHQRQGPLPLTPASLVSWAFAWAAPCLSLTEPGRGGGCWGDPQGVCLGVHLQNMLSMCGDTAAGPPGKPSTLQSLPFGARRAHNEPW